MNFKICRIFILLLSFFSLNSFAPFSPGVMRQATKKEQTLLKRRACQNIILACMTGAASALIFRLGMAFGQANCKQS